ncbi:dynein intermediate chain 3, ciliary-like [Artemia franciscana]|uniref:dynein intermediate chain 3, ciliary-like n=1 Tax=Artemia franciscana TaxID=6661 RepID=UPI0032DABA36
MDCNFLLRLSIEELKNRSINLNDKFEEGINISPDEEVAERFVVKATQEKGIQAIDCTYSAHTANTEHKSYDSRGINHKEGGWPKEVNPSDAELVGRFRKRIEKDDSYIVSVLKLAKSTEFLIRQNLIIDIHEDYFVEEDDYTLAELELIRPMSEDNIFVSKSS